VKDDRPRLLHARSEYGYTDRIQAALPHEPEAVSAEEQKRQTLQARRDDQQRRADAWKAAHGQIDGALQRFKQEGRPDPRTVSDLRVIERQARRVGERLRPDAHAQHGR
jgi:hypothetical protein